MQSWHVEDSPALNRRQNFIRYDRVPTTGSDVLQPKQAVASMKATAAPSSCKVEQTERELDGYGIVTVTIGQASQCSVVVATIDLARHTDIIGQAVYMLVQANVTLPDTSVALTIDGADGTGRHISADWDEHPNSWQMLEYQLSELDPHIYCWETLVAVEPIVCTFGVT